MRNAKAREGRGRPMRLLTSGSRFGYIVCGIVLHVPGHG